MDTSYKELDEKFLKNKRKYKQMLKIARKNDCEYLSEFIIKHYSEKKYSAIRIASDLEAGSYVWIYYFFKEIDIKTRPTGVFAKKINKDDHFEEVDRKLNFKNYKKMKSIAQELGYEYVSEAICDMYQNQNRSLSYIAGMFERTPSWTMLTIKKLKALGIEHQHSNNKLSSQKIKLIKKDFENVEITPQTIREYISKNNLDVSPKTLKRYITKE